MSDVNVDRGLAPYEGLRGLAGMATEPEEFAAVARSVRQRLSPRKNRWAAIREFDERVSGLELRRTELAAENQLLHTRLAAAPAADRDKLAAWQLAGARRSRPEPTVEPLEQEIAARQADHDALTAAIQQTLQAKADYVEKRRPRFVKDAERELEEAYAAGLAAADELERRRAEIVEARETLTWAQLYPHEAVSDPLDSRLLTGGRMEPLRRLLGITSQVDAGRAFEAIRADLTWVKEAATPGQRNALAGVNQRDLHNAAWADSDEGRRKLHDEQRARREQYAREWGQAPRKRG